MLEHEQTKKALREEKESHLITRSKLSELQEKIERLEEKNTAQLTNELGNKKNQK